MKHLFVMLCMLSSVAGFSLPLSQTARQEADLFNQFLEAAYAQRTGDSRRFELLQQALQKAPDSAYIKQQLVSEALAVDTPKLAEAYLDFIDDAQDDPEAWVVYGAYQWRTEHPAQALEAYEKALALDPDDERILYQYIALLAATHPQKAAETLTDLANSRPLFAPDIYTEMGRMYVYHQNYNAALEAFNQAVKLDDKAVAPRMGRAGVYEKTNQYFLMLHELEELEQMGYVTAQTCAQMGSVFVLVQDLPRAETYFLKAKELEHDNVAAGYFLALLAEQRGEYAQAISLLKETRDYASSPAKQIQVSYYQRKLSQPEASLHTLKQAYAQFPDDNEVAYLYAVALYEQDAYAKSARVLAPVVEKLPTNPEVRLQYAFALEGQRNYRAMEEQLITLLEQNPRNAPALNLYAYSLALRNERLDEAADYIARALAILPEDNSFLDTQAWVFYQQGKFAPALDMVRAISDEVLAANPEMAYHAGMIYAANHQPEAARRYLQQAAAGGWKDAKKALKKLN